MLSYVSATGVLASSIFLLSLLWSGTFDGTGFHANGIPTAISLYALCYSSHPIIPSLYISMRNKSQFSKEQSKFAKHGLKLKLYILPFHDLNSSILGRSSLYAS